MALKKPSTTAPTKAAAEKVEAPAKAAKPAAPKAPAPTKPADPDAAGVATTTPVTATSVRDSMDAAFAGEPINEHAADALKYAAGSTIASNGTSTIANASDPDDQRPYDDGYKAGYTDAIADLSGRDNEGASPGMTSPVDFDAPSTGSGLSIATLVVGLALMTPQNQRKGGLAVVVNRLQGYVDQLDPDAVPPALHFMEMIARSRPLDLVTGRFAMEVSDGLEALTGVRYGQPNDTSASSSTAAAERIKSVMPENANPTDAQGAAGKGTGADFSNVDLTDPMSANAAAARLASL